jgi:putative ABC transport system ATP-binding protein
MSIISLKNVSKIYRTAVGDQLAALDNVNLDVEEGEFVAVVGESGSGKTTLLNMIGGLDQPTEGLLLVNGHDITSAGDTELSAFRNKSVGFVFQSFHLQPIQTATANVMLPLLFANISWSEAREKAEHCLSLVELSDKTCERAGRLSAGQCQRVAIARAIVNNPRILLADEPTGNLDAHMGGEILNLLENINSEQKTTILLVTHERDIAARAHRMITIKTGRIVSDTVIKAESNENKH